MLIQAVLDVFFRAVGDGDNRREGDRIPTLKSFRGGWIKSLTTKRRMASFAPTFGIMLIVSAGLCHL